jgi:hypothetical protein
MNIRQYPCNNRDHGRGKLRTHYYKREEKSGSQPNQVVLWYQCSCGHEYSVMQYVAQAQVGPTRWDIEDVSQIRATPLPDPA